MIETPQEYTARILGYQAGQSPMKVLAATPGRIARLLKGIRRSSLTKRPEPDRWSVAEILGHLADSEMVVGVRIRTVLGSNGSILQPYDQDAWARFSHYREQDPRFSLEAFRIQRERTLALLRALPAELWENYGMHAERGRESVARMAEMTAGHDLNHLRQIRDQVRNG